ncbi:MAG: winged helix-turn-helix domain-containing protein [Halobacteriota archaeon]|jgi:ArsR family transcriptional regulator
MVESTQILKVLAGDTRFRILNELMKEPDYTISLAEKLNLESSIITHSLKKLEKHGLLCSYRKGKLKYYGINDKEAIQKLISNLERLNNKG